MKKLYFYFNTNICFGGSMSMIGEKGDPADVSKVIVVKMYDNYYEPNRFKTKKNQTIKFIVYTHGELVHEFNIATKNASETPARNDENGRK